VLVDRLRRHRSSTFRSLTSDAGSTLVVVARFLALLELYREGAVAFDQVTPLGELHIRWTGAAEGDATFADDVEEYDGVPHERAADDVDSEAGPAEARVADADPPPDLDNSDIPDDSTTDLEAPDPASRVGERP
jgi:segregation and condensation protein A